MFKITVEYLNIYNSLIQQLSNVAPLWNNVSVMMDKATKNIFDSSGGVWGISKWIPISSSMMGRVRRGTDGRTWGFYSENTRILQASGNFKKSFKKQVQRPLSMKYGSRYSFTSGGKRVSGNVLPYAGGRGLRDTTPDVNSSMFIVSLNKIEQQFISDVFIRAEASGGKIKK